MSASNIYDLHTAAFSRVSAFVVMDKAERVATIAFKFPEGGAGRLYAYVHWMGIPMVRGFAAGGGYDKKSASVSAATGKLPDSLGEDKYTDGSRHHTVESCNRYMEFLVATRADDGYHWDRRLQDAGFTVLQAV